ncbi:MAG: hypothetical protein JO139_01280 [Alphaproteobacteria bacterium]|nr:hypothetical protein [Alphaproteobacteria bacterium]
MHAAADRIAATSVFPLGWVYVRTGWRFSVTGSPKTSTVMSTVPGAGSLAFEWTGVGLIWLRAMTG